MKTETAAERLYEKIEEIRKKEAVSDGERSPFPHVPLLAAIDGRCGAGKTTLASFLCENSDGASCIWIIFSCVRSSGRKSGSAPPEEMWIMNGFWKRCLYRLRRG